jgi:hypothetical protein
MIGEAAANQIRLWTSCLSHHKNCATRQAFDTGQNMMKMTCVT